MTGGGHTAPSGRLKQGLGVALPSHSPPIVSGSIFGVDFLVYFASGIVSMGLALQVMRRNGSDAWWTWSIPLITAVDGTLFPGFTDGGFAGVLRASLRSPQVRLMSQTLDPLDGAAHVRRHLLAAVTVVGAGAVVRRRADAEGMFLMLT